MMKAYVLRAKCEIDSSVQTPEYADNLLLVEFTCHTPLIGVSELTVCAYSSDLQLIASDTVSVANRKSIRKVCFRLCDSKEWNDRQGYLYIFSNGHPQWFVPFEAPVAYATWKKYPVEMLCDHPKELFFITGLCHREWWNRLHICKFSPSVIHQLLDTLYLQHQSAAHTHPAPHFHMLVKGDRFYTRVFSSLILSAHFTEENTETRYAFPVKEFFSGELGWEELSPQLKQSKAVTVNLQSFPDSPAAESQLNILYNLIVQNTFPNATFILHGTEEDIERTHSRCPRLVQFFGPENTFTVHKPADESSHPETEFPYEVTPMHLSDGEDTVHTQPSPSEEESASAEEQLDELVGLQRLKKDIREARLLTLFIKERKMMQLETSDDNRHHMLFLGNPGTGKTTVARIIGQMYHEMGILSNGHLIETNRTSLVGEYIGHTEKNMRETIANARGGVLFVDEAYTLITQEEDSKDFGKEVINALLPVLSEPNPDMIVILAGYKDKMQTLLNSNPGLKDRFPLHFHFEEYTPEELAEMARRILTKRNFTLTPEAEERLRKTIEKAVSAHDPHFGNGRWVHNLIEQGIIKSMAKRVMSQSGKSKGSRQLFSRIEEEDIIEAEKNFLGCRQLKISVSRPIGFIA